MPTAVRTTPHRSEADDWALVLIAAGIPHRIESAGADWTVTVAAADSARAAEALDAYDAETREMLDTPLPGAPGPLAAAPGPRSAAPGGASPRIAWALGITVAALLIVFFLVTGPPRAGSRWFARGAAIAVAILHGEPWRAVTALTLHVDAAHVIGNAVATAVLLPPLAQRVGPGLAIWLVLLAGTLGNLLSAMVHEPQHAAVGASTATFAAVGALAALRLVPAAHAREKGGRGWLVPVAALLFLTMLGAGRDADIVAHGLGLLTGAMLGLGAAMVVAPPPGPRMQSTLTAAAAVAIVGSWYLALGGAPW